MTTTTKAERRKELDAQIMAAYDRHDGDISTERLIQMCADDCKVDYGRVVAALRRSPKVAS